MERMTPLTMMMEFKKNPKALVQKIMQGELRTFFK
jgi:hypothetical protein